MSEYEKMIRGEFYDPNDPDLVARRLYARKMVRQFNDSEPEDLEIRRQVLKQLFGKTGEAFYIEPPFTCDYGCNIEWGENAYANFDLLILDSAPVRIGRNVMIAPNVRIYTATHPLDHRLRNAGPEYAKPVTIGDNVWVGGGAIINPGVTIGECSVIGSGSVVTKDIPPGVVAVGNPCRVVKRIEEV